jgi:hypothetical protein
MPLHMFDRFSKETRYWVKRGLLVLFAAEELMPELSTDGELSRRSLAESGYLAGYTQPEQELIFGWLLNHGLLQLIGSETYCLTDAGIALLREALDEIAARADLPGASRTTTLEVANEGQATVLTCSYCGDDVTAGMPRDRGVPCCRRCHTFIRRAEEPDLLRGILLALFGSGMFGAAARARATRLYEFYSQLPRAPQHARTQGGREPEQTAGGQAELEEEMALLKALLTEATAFEQMLFDHLAAGTPIPADTTTRGRIIAALDDWSQRARKFVGRA